MLCTPRVNERKTETYPAVEVNSNVFKSLDLSTKVSLLRPLKRDITKYIISSQNFLQSSINLRVMATISPFYIKFGKASLFFLILYVSKVPCGSVTSG